MTKNFVLSTCILLSLSGALHADITRDFDSSLSFPSDWSQSAANGNYNWRVEAGQSTSTPNAMFSPSAAFAHSAYLTSEAFVIQDAASRLKFDHFYDLENGYDGGILEISISGGGWQEITAAGGSILTNGYTQSISTYASGSTIAGKQAWSGNSNGFIATEVSFPGSAVGQSCRVRWHLANDSSVTKTGWWIDNVTIPGTSFPRLDLSIADSTASEPSDAARITITSNNSIQAPLVVSYTVTGSATNGVDYTTLSGTATILQGSRSVNIDIVPIADMLAEGTEQVTITLTSSVNYDIGTTGTASISILDNPDQDGDGLLDSWETANGLDPLDDGSTNPNNGPDGDPDGDGLPNAEEYQLGFNPQSNDFGRAYVARPAKATIMVVSAHPDDEGIFFGGTIPYYTQTLNVPTICISMTSGDYSLAPSVREAEFRNAAWEYGLRNQPIFPRFRDYWIDGGDVNGTWDIWNDNVLGNGDEAAGKLKATEYLATQIRKYRPEVVVSHDVNGEYGHSNHAATGIASADAFAMAGDPSKDLEGLPAWQAKKLYLHRYNTEPGTVSKLFHDHWETSSIGGLTPRQVANNGLAHHATQGSQTVSTAYLSGETASPDFDLYPSEEWGLHTSYVGADTAAADFTVNGTLYAGFAKSDFLQNVSIDSDADLLPDDWENLHSASTVSMNPNADTDNDGLTNLQEFMLGLDPTSPSQASPVSFTPDGTSLSFTLPAAIGTGYVGVTRTYTLESSSDLITWSPEKQGTANGNPVNFPLPANTPRKFYRCHVIVQ